MIKLDVLKYKKIAFLFSILFIVAGVIAFIVCGGFNKGIDFGSGYSETFQVAPLGFTVSYTGKRGATLSVALGCSLFPSLFLSPLLVCIFISGAFFRQFLLVWCRH